MARTLFDQLDLIRFGRETRYSFRHDREVLKFVTNAYGTMGIVACATEGRGRFGGRAPCKSAVHRYWQWLDRNIVKKAA